MSRYSFESGGQRWHVGWDSPTASLFAQVEPMMPVDEDFDDLRDVVGADLVVGEVVTVDDLAARLSGQASIPEQIRTQLAADIPADLSAAAQEAARRIGAVERQLADAPATGTNSDAGAGGLPALVGRDETVRRLGDLLGSRPPVGAGAEVRAGWLRDKAAMHDQIAGYLRQVGDVTGAVEAEVQASRCRIDAEDLTTAPPAAGDQDDWGTTSTGCPWAAGQPWFAAAEPDGTDDVGTWTCGPGLP